MLFVAVFVKAFLDKVAVLQGLLHSLGVAVGAVAAGLVQKFGSDAHAGKLGFYVNLVVARVVFVAAGRVGNHRNRVAQVFFKRFGIGHVGRNFAEHVVVVPRVNEADLLAAVAKGADNQVNGDDFAEVSKVNGSARRDAGSASVGVAFAFFGDDFVGHLVGPVAEEGVFLFAHNLYLNKKF